MRLANVAAFDITASFTIISNIEMASLWSHSTSPKSAVSKEIIPQGGLVGLQKESNVSVVATVRLPGNHRSRETISLLAILPNTCRAPKTSPHLDHMSTSASRTKKSLAHSKKKECSWNSFPRFSWIQRRRGHWTRRGRRPEERRAWRRRKGYQGLITINYYSYLDPRSITILLLKKFILKILIVIKVKQFISFFLIPSAIINLGHSFVNICPNVPYHLFLLSVSITLMRALP